MSLYSWHRDIEIPINNQEESGIVTLGSIELRLPLEVSKGYQASCRDEVWPKGFLYVLHRGFRHHFIM